MQWLLLTYVQHRVNRPQSHLHLHPVSLVRQRWHQSESQLQYLHASPQRSTKTCMVQQSRTIRHPLIVQKNCDQRTISSSHSACSVFTGAIFVQGQDRWRPSAYWLRKPRSCQLWPMARHVCRRRRRQPRKTCICDNGLRRRQWTSMHVHTCT